MSGSITQSSESPHVLPIWTVDPNSVDWLAWGAIICIILAVYLVFFLYAKFDGWAEHQAHGTPLAKTIPTLLGIALLYEIFPLDHFSILLPLSAILIAFMIDWRREHYEDQPDQHQSQNIGQEPAIVQAVEVSAPLPEEGAKND